MNSIQNEASVDLDSGQCYGGISMNHIRIEARFEHCQSFPAVQV